VPVSARAEGSERWRKRSVSGPGRCRGSRPKRSEDDAHSVRGDDGVMNWRGWYRALAVWRAAMFVVIVIGSVIASLAYCLFILVRAAIAVIRDVS